MTRSRFDRYHQLSAQLGDKPARALIDRLQVLALTEVDTLREIEAFIDRGGVPARRVARQPKPDRRRNPDRRRASATPAEERRRGPRRASELAHVG